MIRMSDQPATRRRAAQCESQIVTVYRMVNVYVAKTTPIAGAIGHLRRPVKDCAIPPTTAPESKSIPIATEVSMKGIIGRTLRGMLSQREKLNQRLQETLDQHTNPWGIKVSLEEIKGVDLPDTLVRLGHRVEYCRAYVRLYKSHAAQRGTRALAPGINNARLAAACRNYLRDQPAFSEQGAPAVSK